MTMKLRQDINATKEIFAKQIPDILSAYEWFAGEEFNPAETVLTGLATSLYAWETIRPLVEHLGVSILDTGELQHVFKSSLEMAKTVVVMSRSGESAEIVTLLDNLTQGYKLVAITEYPDSTLGKAADKVFSFKTTETSFANTQSFTLSIAYATALACALTDMTKDELQRILGEATRQISWSITESSQDAKAIAQQFRDINSLLVMTRGNLVGIGRQFVLDLHEGTLISALSIEGALLRHGSIELVRRDDVGSLFLTQADYVGELAVKAAVEISEQGGKVALVTPDKTELPQIATLTVGKVPVIEPLVAPLAYVVYLQMIFHYFLVDRNIKTLQPELVGRITTVE